MKVTCICPTTIARRAWMPQLLQIFESQVYPDKELLFIADGPWIEEFCQRPGVRFVIADGKIGDKRNIGVRFADGEVIVHLDSDDFSSPNRVTDQVARLMRTGKQVTGYHNMLFTDGQKWWCYHGIGAFAFGSSMCYRRQWALDHPFESKQIGEDGIFGTIAAQARQLDSVEAGETMFATIHPGNTSRRDITPGSCWLEAAAPESCGNLFPTQQS